MRLTLSPDNVFVTTNNNSPTPFSQPTLISYTLHQFQSPMSPAEFLLWKYSPRRMRAMLLALSPVEVKFSWTKISSTGICFLEKGKMSKEICSLLPFGL